MFHQVPPARAAGWIGVAATLAALGVAQLAVAEPAPVASDGVADAASFGAADPEAAPPLWQTVAVASPRSSFDSDPTRLRISLAAGDHAAFAGHDALAAGAVVVACRFDLSVSGSRTAAARAQRLRLGDGFSASDADEADARTAAVLGIDLTGAPTGFRLRDLVSGRTSPEFTGTQAVTWVLDASGDARAYDAPDGIAHTLGAGRMDVWVGHQLALRGVTLLHETVALRDLKWYWAAGTGTTVLDHFTLRPLDTSGSPAEAAGATSLAAPMPAAEPGVELYRPMPNPFEKTTRFAYAVGGAARVDVGVYDLAGRRVRTLVRGLQAAGQYETSWDGRADDGARVRNGVYFLRASVGTDIRLARVVYLFR